MNARNTALLTAAALCLMPASGLAITPYVQDFEGLIQVDPDALANDGWIVFGNIYNSSGDYLYGYGPFPAPNTGAAFSAVASGEGGTEQGTQQLTIFSDYESAEHANGNTVESNVFQEQTITAADVGKVWVFDFNAKLGNIEPPSTAAAFIKTLDPDDGFALTNFVTEDMTSIPVTWDGYSVYLYIDASLEGQLFQFGFLNESTDYDGTGIFYDNINVYSMDPVDLYMQNFESLSESDADALADDGWIVYANVTDSGGGFLYNYGPFPAPNHEFGFSAVVTGEGGAEQGAQQLSVYSDYSNPDHGNNRVIESFVYQERFIRGEDTEQTWAFDFNAKLGNLTGGSTAAAFVRTIDPADDFAVTSEEVLDMSSIPVEWSGFTLSLDIDASKEGQLLQFGFLNTATDFEGSGIFYDNINFASASSDAPDLPTWADGARLSNAPNPFTQVTGINFSLEQNDQAKLSVFDLQGRRIATLRSGDLPAGEHSVTWDGMTDSGTPAAAGTYWYVLETTKGQVSKAMTLIR